MKRFEFRPARLERLRAVRRQRTRAALALALAAARECAARRERMETAFDDALAVELPEPMRSDAGVLKQLADWRSGRLRLAQRAAKEEARASELVEDAVEQHARAARSHRVLTRLRERRYRRWLDEVAIEERKFLDETHLLRLVGRRAGKEK